MSPNHCPRSAHPLTTLLRGLAFGALVSALSVGAQAQEGAQARADRWQFTAGIGMAVSPRFPGSDDTKVRAVPLLSADYGHYFVGAVPVAGLPAGVGMYLIRTENWKLGAALGASIGKPRREADAPRLAGLGDIDGTALASLFGSYNQPLYSLRANLVSDVGGNGQGLRMEVDAEGRYVVNPSLVLSAGPGLTWTNNSYTRTFFGVTAAQSAASGLPKYDTGSGINSVSFSVGANYRLTPQWGLSTRLTARRLQGDAVDSPITEDRMQNSIALFASYRF